VVVREDGEFCGEFDAVLAPREDRVPDQRTMEFWKSQPQAWAAATTNARQPALVMREFVAWIRSYPGLRSFAARPLMFDGLWIDTYLRTFADCYLLDLPYWGNNVFNGGTLDIGTYVSGVFGRTDPHTGDIRFPAEWLGNHDHTHRAIDDARGYASLLAKLFGIARGQPTHPDDFLEARR
jgi:hypothetical protein